MLSGSALRRVQKEDVPENLMRESVRTSVAAFRRNAGSTSSWRPPTACAPITADEDDKYDDEVLPLPSPPKKITGPVQFVSAVEEQRYGISSYSTLSVADAAGESES